MKRLTVMDFSLCFGGASEDIPVEIKEGLTKLAEYNNIYKMAEKLSPGIAERKITFVTLTKERITIQVKPYSGKV